MVAALLEFHAVMASGARSPVTDHVREIAGHAARPLAQFAAEHAHDWARPPPLGATEPVGAS